MRERRKEKRKRREKIQMKEQGENLQASRTVRRREKRNHQRTSFLAGRRIDSRMRIGDDR